MPFNIHELKADYLQNKSPYREIGKYLFSLGTFGLGALYLAASTVVIREGQIGVREDARGNITLLPPGRHSNFPWESYPSPVQDLSKPVIKLGPYTLVTVDTGSVAQTINKGVLHILSAGQHLLNAADHIYKSFMSIKQETEELKQIRVFTQDNVGLDVHADVQYQIADPKLAISEVDNIKQSIKEIASMQLSQVISHHTRQELIPAATRLVGHIKDDSGETEEQGQSAVQDELITRIRDKLSTLGITLINVSLKSWDIIDKSLAHELGQGAVIESQTASKLVTARRDAEILQISATAKASAIITEAKATADAAQLLHSTPFAQELELLNKQRDIVAAAKAGTVLNYGLNGIQGFFQNQSQVRHEVTPVGSSQEEVAPAQLT